METETVDVEGIQHRLGIGRFQFCAFFVLGLIYSRGAWHVFGIMFLAGDPGHKCAVPHDINTDSLPFFPSFDLVFSESVLNRNGSIDVTNGIYGSVNSTGTGQADGTAVSTVLTVADFSSTTVSQGDTTYSVKLNWTAEKCSMSYQKPNGSCIKMAGECPYGWSYGSEYEKTILSEWDLVCGRDYMVELSITVFMIGSTVGAMSIPPLADCFGRKRVMMICLLCQAIVGSVTALANSYALFTALRIVIGMLNIGIGLCSYVLITETFPAQNRTVMSIAFQMFWALGVMTVAWFGYLVRNWRHLELLLSLPNFLALPCFWLLPESLPWLISQKRWAEAQSTSERIARLNGKDVRELSNLFSQLPPSHSESSSASLPVEMGKQEMESSQSQAEVEVETDAILANCSHHLQNGTVEKSVPIASTEAETDTRKTESSNSILELFRHKRMLVYCCIMFFLFFVNSLGYFGISFSVPVLHGNTFVNLCIMGAVEVPALCVCVIISQRVGRRIPNGLFLLLCGVCNIVTIFIPLSMEVLKLLFVMLGKFAITAAYSTIYLYSAEIFPTANRNQAMGMSSVFENIGSITAPFMVLAAKSIAELPLVVFGVLCIMGSCLTLVLPETHNRPLPQTVHEITTW